MRWRGCLLSRPVSLYRGKGGGPQAQVRSAPFQRDHAVCTLRDQWTTVVLVTHDLSRVNVLADVVVGMDRGRIASQGSSLTVPDIQSHFGVPAREAARTLGAPYQ